MPVGVYPRPSAIERFIPKIEFTDSCWLWLGTKQDRGYGQFWINERYVMAHRFSYEYFVEPIPGGLTIDHLCCVQSCVNFTHLEPVTHRENLLRSARAASTINVRKTHCIRGHEFNEANTYVSRGWRSCRACIQIRIEEHRKRGKEATA